MLEILAALALGVFAGIITGLTPGIHINLISALVVTYAGVFSGIFHPLSLAVFVISMSVVHTFLDAIPSIFLGAPESATALGVLPGHRYLLKGQGLMAVKLTLIGSYGAVLISIALFPVFLMLVGHGYPIIQPYVGYMLIAVSLFMVLRDRKKAWSAAVFLLSGLLGVIVLGSQIPNPLFPMLSGLFGISTLLISLNESQSIPKQKALVKTRLRPKTTAKALLSGQFSGFLTAVLPGVGAATAAVISLQITRKLGDNGFMVLMGSIGTVNFVLSLAALQAIGKARNGSIIAVQSLIDVSPREIWVFLASALVAGSAGCFLVLFFGRLFCSLLQRIDYKKTLMAVIALVSALVCILTGLWGLLVLTTATAIGLVPAIVKTARTHAMGCLMLPVILYFIA